VPAGRAILPIRPVYHNGNFIPAWVIQSARGPLVLVLVVVVVGR
jgi:hypothetical protein